MPARRGTVEDFVERNAGAEARAGRERRNDMLRSAAACVAWAAVGTCCLMWSVHTTDMTLGRAAFYGGIGIGNGGVIFTLLAAYRRGEGRGDW